MTADVLTHRIIDAAMSVHRELGPGLLESCYQGAFSCELEARRLVHEKEKRLSVTYRGRELDPGYRVDFVVEGKVIVELKSTDSIAPIHAAQLLTFMKLSCVPTGLIINFNVEVLRQGIRRFVLSPPCSRISPLCGESSLGAPKC